MKINGLTITSLEEIHAYSRTTGVCELYLNELQDAEISGEEETQDITGKGDRLLKQIKKNKNVTVTGTSALISGDLLAAQIGAETVTSDETKVRRVDIIEVAKSATSCLTTFTAVGDTGNEIGTIFIQEPNGALGTSYTQGTAASATKFTYDPTTKTITLPTDIASTAAVTIIAFYDYETDGTTITDYSDVFGKTLEVYIDCLATDICDNEYKVQFYFPRGQFSGEFSISMGGDQTVQDFTINTLVDTCAGADEKLFDMIVYA